MGDKLKEHFKDKIVVKDTDTLRDEFKKMKYLMLKNIKNILMRL